MKTHGKSYPPSRVYWSWKSMKARCYNPNRTHYRHYGGRGIKVCDRWLESFENFYEDMGDCPPGLSIDRIDNDGDYTPENCRWATSMEQTNNTSRNRRVTVDGETMTITQWARRLGVNIRTMFYRVCLLYTSPSPRD